MFKILFFVCELIFFIQYLVIGMLLKLFFFKTKIFYEDDSRQNKRIKGSVIFISNHRSFLDGLVVSLNYILKRFHFISEDFFKDRLKIVKFIASVAGSIFIDSKISDYDFIEACKKITAKGKPIIIFPEGGFRYTFEPSKFYTGYILLAINTGTKIIPIVNDFNYGLFKKVNIMIGNAIDLSEYANTELTRSLRKEINEKVYNKYMLLFYQLKRKKAERYSFKYEPVSGNISPKPGDVIRIHTGSYYHYGIYFNDNEIIQFGSAENRSGEEPLVNSVPLKEFCGGKTPEVRIVKKQITRAVRDIKNYAQSCMGQGRYSLEKNNSLDFVNRVTLKI